MNGAAHWRWPLLGTTVLLIATGIAALFFGPLGATKPLAASLVALVLHGPLALFLPACWRVDKRILAWFSFLLMFYFCGYVLQAVDPPPSRYWGLASSLLVCVLFVITVLAMRSRSRTDG